MDKCQDCACLRVIDRTSGKKMSRKKCTKCKIAYNTSIKQNNKKLKRLRAEYSLEVVEMYKKPYIPRFTYDKKSLLESIYNAKPLRIKVEEPKPAATSYLQRYVTEESATTPYLQNYATEESATTPYLQSYETEESEIVHQYDDYDFLLDDIFI